MSHLRSTVRMRHARIRRAFAALLVAVLALTGLSTVAMAATGMTLSVNYGTATTVDGVPKVTAGTTYQASLQYVCADLLPGEVVTLAPPGAVVIPTLPVSTDVFSSISTQPDGSIVLTVSTTPICSGQQGFLGIGFSFDGTSSERTTLTWSLDGVDQSVDLVIVAAGDTPKNFTTNTTGKAGSFGGDFATLVDISAGGVVSLQATATTTPYRYTVTLAADAARSGITISDTINDYLAFDAGSFVASLEQWDVDGLNRVVSAPAVTPSITGNSFTITGVTLPDNSRMTLTYDAYLDAADVAALEADLQAQYDAIVPTAGGALTFSPANSLTTTDGGTGTHTFSLSKNVPAVTVPKPDFGAATSKTHDVTGWTTVEVDEFGALATAIPVTYTMTADLTVFDGSTAEFTLGRNVVMSDSLPAASEWRTGDANFIVVTDDLGATVTLTEVTGIAAGSFVSTAAFSYQVAGQELLLNLGADTARSYTITTLAQIATTTGMWEDNNPSWPLTAETVYTGAINQAVFSYSDSEPPVTKSAAQHLLEVRPATDPRGITDTSKFSKSAPGTVQVNVGEAAHIPFTFEANTAYDLADATIIDYVDHNVFDTSDLAAIAATITGLYEYNGPLDGDDFDLSLDGDGNLLIAPSASYGHLFPAWLTTGAPYVMELTVSLPTHVFNGPDTFRVTNSASLFGPDASDQAYFEEAQAQATSYGDDMEVRKDIYYDGEWTANLRAEYNETTGVLVKDTFIYRVELIPHGTFEGIAIIPVDDVIPTELDFLGFVADANLETGTYTTNSVQPINGNIEALWNDATRTLTLQNQSGTTITQGAPIYVNFMVRINDFTPNVAIVNTIDTESASIIPSNGYPLSISKRDSTDLAAAITDRDARFTISGPSGVVTTDAYVVNNQLRVDNGGADSAIVVAEIGTYTITETVPPVGYGIGDPVTVTVATNGTSPDVTYWNEPSVESYVSLSKTVAGVDGTATSFGFTWAATHATETLTGVQTSGSVTVLGNGSAVVLRESYPSGAMIAFPEGAVVTFTEDAAPAIAGATFGSVAFTNNGGSVPAAGTLAVSAVNTYTAVVPPVTLYAVGDIVWIDANKDGIDDVGEIRLPGVTVRLLDDSGNELRRTVTNSDGRYLFDNLPEGNYQIEFVLTALQAEMYEFTLESVGDDTTDSDANPTTGLTSVFFLGAASPAVTNAYLEQPFSAAGGIDPTWHAGVVVTALVLAQTGVAAVELQLGLAAVLMAFGIGLTFVSRRRSLK